MAMLKITEEMRNAARTLLKNPALKFARSELLFFCPAAAPLLRPSYSSPAPSEGRGTGVKSNPAMGGLLYASRVNRKASTSASA